MVSLPKYSQVITLSHPWNYCNMSSKKQFIQNPSYWQTKYGHEFFQHPGHWWHIAKSGGFAQSHLHHLAGCSHGFAWLHTWLLWGWLFTAWEQRVHVPAISNFLVSQLQPYPHSNSYMHCPFRNRWRGLSLWHTFPGKHLLKSRSKSLWSCSSSNLQ